MTTRDQDIRAIRRLAAAWRSGWLEGDADALLALYADDPVLMPQGHPAVFGKKAISKLYRPVLKHYTFRSRGKLMDLQASGDWAYLWSTYTLTATPKTRGESVRSKGKSVFILKRQRGEWKIAILMDNSDGAPASGGN